ncbi:hypothetical protein MBLNU457_1702t1 [Dothideomycetes sp. NU457]
MQSSIRPHTYGALRLPSGVLKIVQFTPNTVISIGKFGNFPVNLVLGRPYYSTYEIHETTEQDGEKKNVRLRMVPASELNAEILSEDVPTSETRAEPTEGEDGDGFDIVADDGTVLMKNNRLTIDDASRQTLSMEEIEKLKKADTSSGKEIIERIMKAHTNLDEKTTFSLAKYTLRKAKKYIKRFTVLPMDVGILTQYLLDQKEAGRIMELREELLGLITAWSNVHYGGEHQQHITDDGVGRIGGGRWLVLDETSGLVTAAIAEKMGLLYPDDESDGAAVNPASNEEDDGDAMDEALDINGDGQGNHSANDVTMTDVDAPSAQAEKVNSGKSRPSTNRYKAQVASTNTIHLIHANAQPNVSILKYFGYDTNNPSTTHPLHTHLKPLSWLQLLDPTADTTYQEPTPLSSAELSALKSGKRSTYYKKRRRWERCTSIVDETRAGGFDGLVIASHMTPQSVLKHLVPLVRGGGHIVIYSPTIEPLTQLMDLYSKDRKTAYINLKDEGKEEEMRNEDDFPVDPRLLLAPTLQTTRARVYQVLPGRTHPLMGMRGGPEGFVFTARRVVPVEGKVEARGNFSKKRKVAS